MVTNSRVYLLESEKALIELDTGCVWSKVMTDDLPVGIIFIGPSRVAVDAFTETPDGVVGHTVDTTLNGLQLFLGDSSVLTAVSRDATSNDVQGVGFDSTKSLIEAAQSLIGDMHANKFQKSHTDGSILVGQDQSEKRMVLVVGSGKLVLVYDDATTVLSKGRLVTLNHGGIHIVGSEQRHHRHSHHTRCLPPEDLRRAPFHWNDWLL